MNTFTVLIKKSCALQVLSLSTATDDTFHYEKFSVNEWEAAVRAVEIREMAIYHQRLTINSGIARPHLVYQLSPFIPKKAQGTLAKQRLSVIIHIAICMGES